MVIHDGVVMLIFFWNVINIHIYILHVIISHGLTHGATTTSSLSHQSFRLGPAVKSIESMAPGCCGDPWWTLGFGWGTLCSQCQVSCQRLRRGYASEATSKRFFLGHIPCVSYSCFFLSNASVSTSILFAESQCMSYIYIYMYIDLLLWLVPYLMCTHI